MIILYKLQKLILLHTTIILNHVSCSNSNKINSSNLKIKIKWKNGNRTMKSLRRFLRRQKSTNNQDTRYPISSYPVDFHRRWRLISVLRGRGAFVLFLPLQYFPPGEGLGAGGGRFLHERSFIRKIYHVLRVEDVRPERVDGIIPHTGINLDEELPRSRWIEDTGVRQEYVHEARIFVEA